MRSCNQFRIYFTAQKEATLLLTGTQHGVNQCIQIEWFAFQTALCNEKSLKVKVKGKKLQYILCSEHM